MSPALASIGSESTAAETRLAQQSISVFGLALQD